MDKPVHQQLQSPLFRLPVEIRLSIYRFTFEICSSAPKTLAEAELIERCPVIEAPGPRLRYPRSYQSLDLCLLSTCRKLKTEIDAFGSSHRSRHPEVCRLDVIMTDHYALPTWLTAPSHRRDIAYDLEISLRLFDIFDPIRLFDIWDPIPLFGEEQWMATIAAPLIRVLDDLIHKGPQFLSAKTMKSSPQSKSESRSVSWEPEPLRFNVITFHTSCPSKSDPSNDFSNPRNSILHETESAMLHLEQQAFHSMSLLVSDLEEVGLLWGKVEEFRACSIAVGIGIAAKVTDHEIDQVKVDRWAENGFKWGTDD